MASAAQVGTFQLLTVTAQEYLAFLKYLVSVGRLRPDSKLFLIVEEISVCQLQPLLAKHGSNADSKS